MRLHVATGMEEGSEQSLANTEPLATGGHKAETGLEDDAKPATTSADDELSAPACTDWKVCRSPKYLCISWLTKLTKASTWTKRGDSWSA